jgi:hypothetical protein
LWTARPFRLASSGEEGGDRLETDAEEDAVDDDGDASTIGGGGGGGGSGGGEAGLTASCIIQESKLCSMLSLAENGPFPKSIGRLCLLLACLTLRDRFLLSLRRVDSAHLQWIGSGNWNLGCQAVVRHPRKEGGCSCKCAVPSYACVRPMEEGFGESNPSTVAGREPILSRKSVISLSDVCRDIGKGSHVFVVADFGPGLITPYVNRVEVFLRRTPALRTSRVRALIPIRQKGHGRPPHH